MSQLTDSTLAEYEALHSGRGFASLDQCTTVVFTGKDRSTFLQNMCTNDIRRLATGDSCEAFFTDVKGKIAVHGLVVAQADRLLLVTVPDQAESLICHLDRYIIREDVQLANISADMTWFAIFGQLATVQRDDLDDSVSITSKLLSEMQVISCSASSKSNVVSQLKMLEVRPCNLEALNILRIESKLPLFGIDFTSANLPQEVDRDAQAICFNKGCYLGQETIARIDALGHVNQKLVLLKFSSEVVPSPGLELQAVAKTVRPRYQQLLVTKSSIAIGASNDPPRSKCNRHSVGECSWLSNCH